MADALAIAELRSHAVAKSTIAQRGVAFNKWSAFCEARGCDPIRRDGMTPFNLNLAEAFIADLTITQGLQGDTAKKYLLAVGQAHKSERLPNPVDTSRLTGDWTLRQAVQAGLNVAPAGGNKRVGFDAQHVSSLLQSSQFRGNSRPALTYSALASVSFLCLARAQMFTTAVADEFDALKQVTRGDVTITQRAHGGVSVSIFLPAGKANPNGRELVCESTGHSICAASDIVRLLAATEEMPLSGPLFTNPQGGPLTYRQWYTVLRKAVLEIGLSPERYGTHSFRRGGATALYNQTGDIELVESVGGWSHNSGTAWTYVEVDLQRLAAQASLIVTADPVQLPARVKLVQREKRLREEAEQMGGQPQRRRGGK